MRHLPLAAVLTTLVAAVLTVPLSSNVAVAQDDGRAIGDTLTVIARPLLSIPEIVLPGGAFTIEARASSSTSGWNASLLGGGGPYPLSMDGASYDSSYERWFISVTVPAGVPQELYDLELEASGGVSDVESNAVMVRQSIDDSFYFVHITDTHLPTHLFYYENGADSDTSSMSDLHAVIDDINVMNPAFVVLTGDVVNEGELEDFLDKRYYTRAKRILRGFDVPVFITGGNHDLGGWDDTPPPDGTARRNWWKFFGWSYLYDPPSGDNIYTQNYSFDYGGAHFVGLEAYNNYDRWRRTVYGNDSFTTRQLNWLNADLAAAPASAPVVAFYHMDFQDQLNLSSLGIDCALWGHIHYTDGSTSSAPYNLATDNVCDGNRAMRVVRIVDGSSVDPSEPISAGSTGSTLRLAYEYDNNGTRDENAASIVNNQSESFEHALIKFHMDGASAPYEVDNGELFQTVTDSGVATCYVRVAATAHSITVVNITPQQDSGVDGPPEVLSLVRPAWPNPAVEGASLSFSLGVPGPVSVDLYDVSGRHVRSLASDGMDRAGQHEVKWDLTDEHGGRVTAGVYFWRVRSGEASLLQKVVVL